MIFDDRQIQSVGTGFAEQVATSGYVIHACAILPSHSHLVIARHHYAIEQVGRLLRQAATDRLLTDGLHPFADRREPNGRLPSVWGQDFWKVFLFTPEEVAEAIAYAALNLSREGRPPQDWPFLVPYTPAGIGDGLEGARSDASAKRR